MILVLSRGAFCPKDRQQHRLLVELEPEIGVAYTKIVTISTDGLLELNEMRAGVGAHWPFLSDVGRTIQRIWTSSSTQIRSTIRWLRTRFCLSLVS